MNKLIDPGELISGSWDNFRRNIRTYTEFAVWYSLLAVIQTVLTIASRSLFSDVYFRNVMLFLMTLPVGVAAMAVTASLIDATNQGILGKPVSPRASFQHGLHKLIPFIIVSVLISLTYIASIAVFAIPAFLAAFWYFIGAIFPIFIFAVWFWFAPFEVIVDDKHGTQAMAASKRLVKGRWWGVAIRLLLPAIFFYVAAEFMRRLLFIILGVIFGDAGAFMDYFVLAPTVSNTQLLVITLVNSVVYCILLPLASGSYLLLWQDLKRSVTRS